ncbi:hypothetical protein BLNAU_3493 [Blattamonas nauphoetae]|uniref:Uncharacterized protein n=1 Tax=Blattamonas nauphoetae TaxID=2049346 RepID=A0ABQ9YC97_9EUKA|nr:hypothetical protein BLNAU_3493 [Blattamonas nauphoetae]
MDRILEFVQASEDVVTLTSVCDVPVEKRKLLRQSLATLLATPIGHSLSAEVLEKLRTTPPRQWQLTINLVTGGYDTAVVPDTAAGIIRMDINLDDVNLDMQHTFLKRKKDRSLGFFRAIYPLSVTLGHELGHVLQFMESPSLTDYETPTELSMIAANRKRYDHLIARVIGKLRHKATQILLETNHRGRIKDFNPAKQSVQNWILSSFAPWTTKEQALQPLFTAVSVFQSAWNGQYDDLPNILPEHRSQSSIRRASKRKSQFSDGELLRQVLDLYKKNHLTVPDPPQFLTFPQYEGTGMHRQPVQRVLEYGTVLSADPETRFVRWGHHCNFQVINPSEHGKDVVKYWQELAAALVRSVGIDTEKLPSF